MRLHSWIKSAAGRLSAGLVLAAALAGCSGAGGEMTPIKDEADFNRMVMQSHHVVMVDFYKGGCLTCVMLEPTLDQLTREYKGRVTVAKFMIVTSYFMVTSQKLKDRYNIAMFPTVIIFADGKERGRLALDYDINVYRKMLDAQVGVTPPAAKGRSADSEDK